ncbi:hypothetical protein AK812_SmicGene41801 [Symbiodinium microadriaticum]|uniref:Uncharacterized protein n=1 Tax=Symbiodinium microadriaticum TaxID=2951 RepID=A0A1Q9C579_SYMMI|nr:hypothetical protein AK812_SmicGene41801 [Symbiodinium microadriaticum]
MIVLLQLNWSRWLLRSMALAVMVLFSTSHSADDDGGPRATKVLSANIGTITCIYAFIMVAVFRDSGVHVLLLLLRLLLRELELLLLLLLVPTCRFPHKVQSSNWAEGRSKRRQYFHDEAFPGSDVDLFLYGLGEKEAEAKLVEIFEAVQAANPYPVVSFRSAYAVTFHCISSKVLMGFDVDSCACGYDGQNVFVCQRTAIAFAAQANTVEASSKYAERGFEVLVPSLERDRVDPFIYEKRDAFEPMASGTWVEDACFDQVQGLARLLLLERLRTPEARFQYRMEQRLKKALLRLAPASSSSDAPAPSETAEARPPSSSMPWGATRNDEQIMAAINGGNVLVHPTRLPKTSSALQVVLNNIQKSLKLVVGQNGGWSNLANEYLLKMLAKPKRVRKEKPAIMDAQPAAIVDDVDKNDNPLKIDDNAAGEPKEDANHEANNDGNRETDNAEKNATKADDSDSDSSSSSASSSIDEEAMDKMLKDTEPETYTWTTEWGDAWNSMLRTLDNGWSNPKRRRVAYKVLRTLKAAKAEWDGAETA